MVNRINVALAIVPVIKITELNSIIKAKKQPKQNTPIIDKIDKIDFKVFIFNSSILLLFLFCDFAKVHENQKGQK